MELFDEEIDQDRDSKDSAEQGETRQAGAKGKGMSSRRRKTGKVAKKRHSSRKTSGRRRGAMRGKSPVVPSETAIRSVPRPEPPPIIPQPSLEGDDEEPSTDEGEQRQEPPPPSASAVVGDDDDLFEYVF